MRTIFDGPRGDFLSCRKLLPAMFLQKKSIMQALAVNMLMGISIVRIVCECFFHDRKTGLMLDFYIAIRFYRKS